MSKKIAASIVLYNPEIARLKENISSVINQVNQIVLVDNGSKNIEEIDSLEIVKNHCVLVKNRENKGLARALNQAMEWAAANKYEWVLTLDQDSVVDEKLIQGLAKHIDKEKIGIMAPKYLDRNSKLLSDIETGWKFVLRCITSASLTKVSVWREVGGFNEELFIDYVDYDFCARIVRNGYGIIMDSDAMILHEIGHAKQIFFGNRSYVLYNHSAFRDYYIVRNTLYYCYAYPDVWDVKKEKKDLWIRIMMIAIFEQNRWEKICAMFKGWKDSKRLISDEKKRKKKTTKDVKDRINNYAKLK